MRPAWWALTLRTETELGRNGIEKWWLKKEDFVKRKKEGTGSVVSSHQIPICFNSSFL